MAWMMINCGFCGHQADIDEFTRTPIGGELPRNVFQCPECKTAWERRPLGPGIRFDNGHYIPPPVAIVQVQGRL